MNIKLRIGKRVCDGILVIGKPSTLTFEYAVLTAPTVKQLEDMLWGFYGGRINFKTLCKELKPTIK